VRIECASLSECRLEDEMTLILSGGCLEKRSGWNLFVHLASPAVTTALFDAVCRGMTRAWCADAVVALDADGASACIEARGTRDAVVGLRSKRAVHRAVLRELRAVHTNYGSCVVLDVDAGALVWSAGSVGAAAALVGMLSKEIPEAASVRRY
jgi:hypothetical protein